MKLSRRLPLEGLYNCRDLGGYPTRDGGVTAFGKFIRSEATFNLCRSDLYALRDYGIRSSADLRSEKETASRPSDLSCQNWVEYRALPLFNVSAIPTEEKPDHKPWGKAYIDMAEDARDWAVQCLDFAASCPGGLLFHCTTGKDRSGLLACYLLSIAGVYEEDIVADYAVSEIYLRPLFKLIKEGKLMLGPAESPMKNIPDDFFSTPASAMAELLDYFTATYGGAVSYLKTIGVTENTLNAIRAKLVEG